MHHLRDHKGQRAGPEDAPGGTGPPGEIPTRQERQDHHQRNLHQDRGEQIGPVHRWPLPAHGSRRFVGPDLERSFQRGILALLPGPQAELGSRGAVDIAQQEMGRLDAVPGIVGCRPTPHLHPPGRKGPCRHRHLLAPHHADRHGHLGTAGGDQVAIAGTIVGRQRQGSLGLQRLLIVQCGRLAVDLARGSGAIGRGGRDHHRVVAVLCLDAAPAGRAPAALR